MSAGYQRACLVALSVGLAACSSPTEPSPPPPPPPVMPSVRLVYAVPQDRSFRSDYSAAIAAAFPDIRSWYREQMDGLTFTLYRSTPEYCTLPETADFYRLDTWTRTFNGVQTCLPIEYNSPEFRWAVYADVEHECDAPGRIGAATRGVTILGSGDLEGLIGNIVVNDCGKVEDMPVERYVGGAAHELGHTFGLPHPPGCVDGSSWCDYSSLMWMGYRLYPHTHLREEDKAVLRASPFFR